MPNTPSPKTLQSRAAAKQPRISQKVKDACTYIARNASTQREAADTTGVHWQYLSRALAKPHVRAFLDEQKTLFAQEVEDLKGQAKQQAIVTGLDLLKNAKSEAVKARLVEFFAGEDRKTLQNQVNVAIAVGGQGYEFAPHGAELVEINPDQGATDQQSAGDVVQEPENKG